MSNFKDDGGYAFPIVETTGKESVSPGMTLRDYFAAQAMQALIAKAGMEIREHTEDGVLIRPARVAIPPLAYEYADAMLQERKS